MKTIKGGDLLTVREKLETTGASSIEVRFQVRVVGDVDRLRLTLGGLEPYLLRSIVLTETRGGRSPPSDYAREPLRASLDGLCMAAIS
jgi:hypothetical protein